MMKITIHQPQYIPWLPYFLKIMQADTFVVLDTVSFQKNGVQNRNAIKTGQGELWLTIPVRQKLGTTIKDLKIAQPDWSKKQLKTLVSNYSKAPYFTRYFPEFEAAISEETDSFFTIIDRVFKLMMSWLAIEKDIIYASQLSVGGSSSELILNICKKLNATTYISGTGGKNYLDESTFKTAGINLNYVSPQFPNEYPQCFPKQPFINSLSALDILFNCGPEWRQYIAEKPHD